MNISIAPTIANKSNDCSFKKLIFFIFVIFFTHTSGMVLCQIDEPITSLPVAIKFDKKIAALGEKHGERNVPIVYHSAYNCRQFRGGRAEDSSQQIKCSITNPLEMDFLEMGSSSLQEAVNLK